MAKKQTKKLHEYFHFSDPTEHIIFMAWALFVAAFLLTIVK